METITLTIPEKIESNDKFRLFPEYSYIIMSALYKQMWNGKKAYTCRRPQISVPNNKRMPLTYFCVHDGVTDLCKCKLRINMPSSERTFLVDTEYVKDLAKYMNDHPYTKTKGILVFPVINERKIYMINIDKLKKEMISEHSVNNTYSEVDVCRKGQYYFIPKNECIPVKMPECINFVFESEKKEIKEVRTAKTNSLI